MASHVAHSTTGHCAEFGYRCALKGSAPEKFMPTAGSVGGTRSAAETDRRFVRVAVGSDSILLSRTPSGRLPGQSLKGQLFELTPFTRRSAPTVQEPPRAGHPPADGPHPRSPA